MKTRRSITTECATLDEPALVRFVSYDGAWFAIGQKGHRPPFNGLIDEAEIFQPRAYTTEIQGIFQRRWRGPVQAFLRYLHESFTQGQEDSAQAEAGLDRLRHKLKPIGLRRGHDKRNFRYDRAAL